jgi:hypothetical protein
LVFEGKQAEGISGFTEREAAQGASSFAGLVDGIPQIA